MEKMEKMQWEVDDDGRLINETFEEDFYLKFHFDVLFPLFLNKTKQGGLGMCQFRRKTFFQLGKQWKKSHDRGTSRSQWGQRLSKVVRKFVYLFEFRKFQM